MTGTMTSNAPGSARGELSYERRGSGRPLVLMHGWSLTWQSWLPVLDLLAAERDVIAIDLPGFGDSPALAAGDRYTIERLCDEVEAFFAGLGLDRPDVAGCSRSGWPAAAASAPPPGCARPASTARSASCGRSCSRRQAP